MNVAERGIMLLILIVQKTTQQCPSPTDQKAIHEVIYTRKAWQMEDVGTFAGCALRRGFEPRSSSQINVQLFKSFTRVMQRR